LECDDLSAILVFSCVGRFRTYQTEPISWDEAARAMCENWSTLPLIGVLGSGEFGVDTWRESRAHNLGVSVCCLGRVAARPSRTGDLQNKLLEWADRLTACRSPREVMETALLGAVEAGALGGQFCIVDDAIGRILGDGHGCALSPPESKQNWPLVLSKTNRKVPRGIGGRFPRALRDWSLPVRHGVALTWSDTAVPKEDILTLIVRTLQAVYVPDPEDNRFQCRKELAREGNIRAFLAIPLVGSSGKSIATLQLSFPDGALSDRDVFRLWVGYGQKVGAALERTQEAEERSITTSISAFGNQLMQDTATLDLGPHAWCDSFLEQVTQQLGADAAHIRLLQPSTSGEEYRLVGAVGRLGELRRRTRLVTSEGQGSCNRRVLTEGGYFTSTREETGKRNADVRPISEVDDYGTDFQQKLAAVKATALLPIYHRRDLLGSFVIDASRAYFFTERWRRIVKAAAETAGAVLCGRMAAYDNLVLEEAREWQDREKQWMVDTMISATQGDANERLSQLLQRLCTQLEADVGSIYVWHAAAERLVLHTSYNWHESKEGEASYALGEGWTGTLALDRKAVRFVSSKDAPAEIGSKKYYRFMVLPQDRVALEVPDPRIGVRLSAGDDLVGVVTFSYHREHDDRLVDEDERFEAFLNAMAGLITLAVERALDECVQREEQRLRTTMNTVAEHLIAASQPGASWQDVMDDIRAGFQVERVSLYHIQDGQIKHGWSSTCEGGPPGDSNFGPVEPPAAMAGLIHTRLARFRTIRTDADAEQMAGWPNLQGVQYVAAFPVLDTQQTVRGVLEFVNRIPSREHPFDTFDVHELIAAESIARTLGAAIDHRDQWQAALELRSQLATAAKIGASSLSGAIVMHRLLAPFGSIQRAVDWLELFGDRPSEKRTQALRDIRDACQDAEAVIQDAAQRGSVARERASLQTIVNQAVKAVQTEIRSPRIRVRLDPGLAALVEVNVFSIVGALVNILSNAVDAMGEEGVLTVVTHLGDDRRHAVIQVHNTGPSLTAEEIAHALAVGTSGKRGPHHLGLGLPLARRAIEDVGGRFKIHSPNWGGVEVEVSLPLAAPETFRETVPQGDWKNEDV